MNIDTLLRLGRVGTFTIGADSVVVAVERLDESGARFVSDLWSVPLNGGTPTQLTRGDTRDRAPRFDRQTTPIPRDDDTVLFLSDRKVGKDDDAKTQVWALPPHGEPYVLTDEPLGVSDFRIAQGVLVVMTEVCDGVPREALAEREKDRKKHGPSVLHYRAMPVRYWDHWIGPTRPTLIAFDLVTDPQARSPRDLTPEAGDALREADWDLSADGKTVAVTWTTMNVDDRIPDKSIALIDTATGLSRRVGTGLRVVNTTPRVTPDGRVVAMRYRRKNDGYGARSLWLYGEDAIDAHTGRALTGDDWDRWPTPSSWRQSDGDRIVVTFEERGRVRLAEVDLEGHVHPLGPDTFEGEPFSWEQIEVRGDMVVGVVSRLLHPPELVRLDLTNGVSSALASLSGDVPTRVTFRELDVPVPDHDGRAVHTIIVEPPIPNGKTIFWIHGGPVAAWGHRWHGRWCARLMADQGFRVVLPNPAGSTGYGLSWVDDIWGNTWGDQCYRDLMAVVDHLGNQGIYARDTVVMGGSFGGYMTNWIGGQTDRFALLVTHASLFSLSGFQGDTDMPAWWELMMGTSPWDDPDYDRFSPSKYVRHWKTPALILHGEKDYRVPIGEGLALFEALTRQGTDAELVVFPDENHWILKPKNIAAWYASVLDFIARKWPATDRSAAAPRHRGPTE